jgi:hypothetical protein
MIRAIRTGVGDVLTGRGVLTEKCKRAKGMRLLVATAALNMPLGRSAVQIWSVVLLHLGVDVIQNHTQDLR